MQRLGAVLNVLQNKSLVDIFETQEAGGAEQSVPGQGGKQRRWTASQTREFGDLHALLAYLILACDMKRYRPHRSS